MEKRSAARQITAARVRLRAQLGLVTLITAALSFAFFTPAASADEGSPFSFIGQETPKIVVYTYSYNPTWQTPMNAALANWNAT